MFLTAGASANILPPWLLLNPRSNHFIYVTKSHELYVPDYNKNNMHIFCWPRICPRRLGFLFGRLPGSRKATYLIVWVKLIYSYKNDTSQEAHQTAAPPIGDYLDDSVSNTRRHCLYSNVLLKIVYTYEAS